MSANRLLFHRVAGAILAQQLGLAQLDRRPRRPSALDDRDADLIQTILEEEERAAVDRAFAFALSAEEAAEFQQLANDLEALNLPREQDNIQAAEPQAADLPPPEATVECVAGSEWHPESSVGHTQCSHAYCRRCLQHLFTACLTDESLFPPRCCGQAMSLNFARRFLPPSLVRRFSARKVEMETPNRTYCHVQDCSRFILPRHIENEKATCFRCGATTCAICKGPSHEGDCPHDPAAQELMRVAAENGWQQCGVCRRLVELDHGCNHMSGYPIIFRCPPAPQLQLKIEC